MAWRANLCSAPDLRDSNARCLEELCLLQGHQGGHPRGQLCGQEAPDHPFAGLANMYKVHVCVSSVLWLFAHLMAPPSYPDP